MYVTSGTIFESRSFMLLLHHLATSFWVFFCCVHSKRKTESILDFSQKWLKPIVAWLRKGTCLSALGNIFFSVMCTRLLFISSLGFKVCTTDVYSINYVNTQKIWTIYSQIESQCVLNKTANSLTIFCLVTVSSPSIERVLVVIEVALWCLQ